MERYFAEVDQVGEGEGTHRGGFSIFLNFGLNPRARLQPMTYRKKFLFRRN